MLPITPMAPVPAAGTLRPPKSFVSFEHHMRSPMAARRKLIEPHKGDKRYVRRNPKGQFKEGDDMGRSLAQDRRRKAKTVAPRGQRDRGDRRVSR
jgi:hypothetical protein